MIEWRIKGWELVNCNCDYGCPCQFNALPTDGTCAAAHGYQIHEGHFGEVDLAGLRAASLCVWPGPVHGGNGRMLLIIDPMADDAQRQALLAIMTGEETEPMTTMWSVYSAMCPTKLEPLFVPIDLAIDVEGRTGHIIVEGVFETTGEPIRNPVTGAVNRVRIDMPGGFEYSLAEIGSASTKATGDIKLEFVNSHGQFAELDLSNTGVVRSAA